jgi:hypothetical protein
MRFFELPPLRSPKDTVIPTGAVGGRGAFLESCQSGHWWRPCALKLPSCTLHVLNRRAAGGAQHARRLPHHSCSLPQVPAAPPPLAVSAAPACSPRALQLSFSRGNWRGGELPRSAPSLRCLAPLQGISLSVQRWWWLHWRCRPRCLCCRHRSHRRCRCRAPPPPPPLPHRRSRCPRRCRCCSLLPGSLATTLLCLPVCLA